MKKLSNTKAELKKHVMASVAILKAGKTSIFFLNQIQGKMRSITVMYY